MHMIRPVPNLNGSQPLDLAMQMSEASRLIEAALQHMRTYRPHGRDYQIGGNLAADTAEFERRHRVMAEIAEQYMEEADQVARHHR